MARCYWERSRIRTLFDSLAAKNNIADDRFTTFCGDITSDPQLAENIGNGYDLVCANIVADVLKAMSGLFKNFVRRGGKLIISGIINTRKDEVTDVIAANGFRLERVSESEDWTAAVFTAV